MLNTYSRTLMPHSDTIRLTQALIQRPSVTPDDQGCQALIAERLSALGFHCEPMRFGEVDNLWATRGASGPLFVFAGHTDVVPTGPSEQWTHPPFAAEIHDGILYGRGAADMKGSVAAMITAVERFLAATPSHSGRIGFLLTSDEEGPAKDGTKAVVEALGQRGEQIDTCLIGEPTSVETLGDMIKIGRRGSLSGKLTVHGKQGHIAYPQLASNAVHLALPLLDDLVNTTWDQGNQHFPPTTFQISNLHAGTGVSNVIPGSVEIDFNLRFSPECSVESIEARVEEAINNRRLNAEVAWSLSGLPFQTRYGEFIQHVEAEIEALTGRKPELSTSGGTSDGRFISPTGSQVIEFGPSNATIHQIDECVSCQSLDQLSTAYEGILRRVLAALA